MRRHWLPLLPLFGVFVMLGSLDSSRMIQARNSDRVDGSGQPQSGFVANEQAPAPSVSLSPHAPQQKAGTAATQESLESTANINNPTYSYGTSKNGYRRQGGAQALRQGGGQAPGQTSNVPGTTSTSPNGTSSIYGGGGIPIFPSDIYNK